MPQQRPLLSEARLAAVTFEPRVAAPAYQTWGIVRLQIIGGRSKPGFLRDYRPAERPSIRPAKSNHGYIEAPYFGKALIAKHRQLRETITRGMRLPGGLQKANTILA